MSTLWSSVWQPLWQPAWADPWGAPGPAPTGNPLAEFSAIYARMGEPFWRAIGYFPPALSGSGTLDLAELHAASLYF
jgi:hypothetical protein